MTDIAELGLVIRSDGVVVAKDRLRGFKTEAGLAETAVSKLTTAALRLVAAYATWQVATAVIGKFVSATIEAERAQRQLEVVIKSTGGAAGLTAMELSDMASAMQRVTTYGDETIKSAQALLLTFTRIGREAFPEALEATMNVATAMGTDLNSAAIQVGKALNDPVLGMTALTRSGIQFTEEQKRTVKAMVDIGNVAGAQKVILKELETQFGGTARAARDTLGGSLTALGEAFGDLFEANGPEADRLKEAVESLIRAITDPQFISAIQNLGANILSAFADAIPFVTELVKQVNSLFNRIRTSGDTALNSWRDLGEDGARSHVGALLGAGRGHTAGASSFGSMDQFFNPATEAAVASLRAPPGPANDNGGGMSPAQIEAIEKAEKAYAKLIKTTQERIAQLGVEAEALGMTGYAADEFRNVQTLLTEAQATGLTMTPELTAQITALGELMTEAQWTLEGLHLVLENRSPWEVMAEQVEYLNEQMKLGNITAKEYAAEMGKAAEVMASKYASAASGILGQVEKLTDALGLQGREAFEVQKALSIANAVVAGGEAIIKSYSWGTTLGGPVGGALAAGLAAAATAAQIAAIASSSFDSKTVPNAMGGGSSGAAAAPAAASQQRAVYVTLVGDGFTGGQIGGLLRQLGEGLKTNADGASDFLFEIKQKAA